MRKQMLKKTREQINEKFAGKEIHIIKAVNLLGDLDSINNLMRENLNEWQVRTPNGEALEAFGELEKNLLGVEDEKTKLNEFIQKEMRLEFPNFSEVATPIIGAKLLAEAGSKKRLCFMPASTIQVLGAEKALFAHLRKNAKSPKHGHLFNHPLLQNLPRFKRGKAARMIAGKLAIALKQDYFGGENTSAETKKLLEEKITLLLNEPETPEQKQKEMEYEQINAERRRETFTKETKKRDLQADHRTFTPEERKAFFEKNNSGKPWTKVSGNYPPREGSLSQKRKFGPRIAGELTDNYQQASFDPSTQPEYDAPRERPYSPAPRRDSSWGNRGSPEFSRPRTFDRDRPAYGASSAPRPYSRDRPAYGSRPAYGASSGPRTFNRDRPSFGSRPSYGSRPYSRDRPAYGASSNTTAPSTERDAYNSEKPYQRREEGQFHSDFKPRPSYRSEEGRHSRPSGHSSFGSNKFGNKSKPSFSKRTPRTSKRY